MKKRIENRFMLFFMTMFAFWGMLSAEAEGTRETYEDIRFDIEDKTYSDILSADGGAIWAKNSGTASAPSTIKNSTFTNNATTGIGGAISAIISKIIISDTQFKDNRAANMGGGAIYACDSELTIEGTTFGGTGASDINLAKYGGAVYTVGISDTQTSSTTIKKSSFINNKASESGGSIFAKKNSLTISNATKFNGNTATENGGAIFAEDSTVNIKNATAYELANEFEGNTAHRNGGALYLNIATAEIAGETTFKDNSGTLGGAIYANNTDLTLSSSNGRKPFFSGNEATLSGGAIYFASDNSNNLKVLAANFTDNEAVELGGAIYNKGGLLVVEDSYFYGNKATRQRAATYAGGKGGAINIYKSNNDSNKIKNTKFGMDSNPGNEAENGGAIWAYESKLTIEDSIFKSNKATETGGAIYAQNGSTIMIKDTDFTENKATSGAAIFSQSGIVDILAENKDVLFENNNSTGTAGGTGTGIFINSGTLNLIANEGRTINIQDEVIVAGSLNDNGILNINKDVTGNPTTGTVWFNNTLTLSYATTTLYGGTLQLGTQAASSEINEFVIGGDSTLDLQNNYANDNLTVNQLSGNSTLNLNVDYSGAATGTMDKITVGASSGSPKINLNSINIVAEGTAGTTQTVKYLDGVLDSVTVENKTIKIATSKKNVYTFTQDNVLANKGILTVEISSATNSLPDYIQDKTLGIDKFDITNTGYRVFVDDATTTNTLGVLGGTDRTFTISGGNGNEFDRTINGILSDNTKGFGVTIESGQTLILQNISDFTNFQNTITNNDGTVDIDNVTFSGNESDYNGGVINADGGTLNIENTTFGGTGTDAGNTAMSGGAIWVNNSTTTITGSTFTNNEATNGAGGAIYAGLGTTTITDTNFKNNIASEGAAIYASGETTSVIAKNQDVTFENNNSTGTAGGTGTGIEVDYGGTLNLIANQGRTINIQDEVTVNGTLNINKEESGNPTTGTVLFNNKLDLSSATTTLYGGTLKLGANAENNLSLGDLVFNGGGLDLRNGVVNTINPSSINFASASNLYLDVDLANQQMDRFDSSTAVTGTGNINVAGLQIISDREGITTVDFANDSFKDNVYYTGDAEVETISRLYRYKVSYLNDSGQFNFARVQSKNPYNSFNPAVYGSTSAMQGVFLSQVANYDIALGNIDQNMLLTQSQKFALKYGNKYAANDETNPQVYSPLFIPEENKGIWFRPYASVEDVKLDNGPKVENQMYGALVGGDTDLFYYDNGWDAQYSAYVGYNGSHQAYSGNGIWQNGGMLGITGAFFKGNFFEALTANVGASHAEIKTTSFGNNDLGILSTGIASKTGYNWELADGKFIIQPSLTMSYSFVALLNDYTLKNGVRIKNSNLNAMQLAPGLKFIGNLKYGWQPYLNFRMVWNILDDSKVKAAEVSLPETTVKPYFEYGLGVQKNIGERLSGFGQAMFRAGGRVGAAFSVGFRWALGDLNDKHQAQNKAITKTSSKTLKLRTLSKK